jgi:hypothetical protein
MKKTTGRRLELDDQAAGCSVTREDVPFVVASLACFMIFINYGASAASLGK